MLFSHLLPLCAPLAAAAPPSVHAEEVQPTTLQPRQNFANSTCLAYGVDIKAGGSYFINSQSNQPFTFTSEFDGCNNDTASIMLVNMQTGDEYECSDIQTIPDFTVKTSTCPITHSQLTTGNYTILTLGDNGSGNPYAYQRDFYLTIAPQQTVTVTASAPYTMLEQATSTKSVTTNITVTSSSSSNQTVTSDTAGTSTITPASVIVSQRKTESFTFTRWTLSTTTTTTSFTTVPSCSIPSRQTTVDYTIRFKPTKIPLPKGLVVQPGDLGERPIAASLHKRGPDAPTITTTTTVPNGQTITSTLPPITTTETVQTTITSLTTLPPSTVFTDAVSTVTAPTPTSTVYGTAYTRAYVTKTMTLVWADRQTVTPSAWVTACSKVGGQLWW